MARPRKAATHSLSPSQASYVLEKALTDRKITRADVDGYIAQMQEEIETLQSRLAALREAVTDGVMSVVHRVEDKVKGGAPPFPKNVKDAGGDPPFPKKRKKRVSAERRASMKTQGEYLGLISSFTPREKVTFKALAKKEGREKAIEAMKRAKKV